MSIIREENNQEQIIDQSSIYMLIGGENKINKFLLLLDEKISESEFKYKLDLNKELKNENLKLSNIIKELFKSKEEYLTISIEIKIEFQKY